LRWFRLGSKWRRWHGAGIQNSFFDVLAQLEQAPWLVSPSLGTILAGLLVCGLHFFLWIDCGLGFCRVICCGHGLGVGVEIRDLHLRGLRVV
jgi:hypothetical protein